MTDKSPTTDDRHICDYPVCSVRGAGHPLACNCRSDKSQTTSTQVQGMTWKCPKCRAWPYINRKKCFVCGTARPGDVKRKAMGDHLASLSPSRDAGEP